MSPACRQGHAQQNLQRTELQERSKNYLQEAICKWIFVCSYSAAFLSENVQLLKMKAVRPPAARQPRSPKAKPASETSAPGSTDTFSIYQIVSLLVRMATSRITFFFFFLCNVFLLSVASAFWQLSIKAPFFIKTVFFIIKDTWIKYLTDVSPWMV